MNEGIKIVSFFLLLFLSFGVLAQSVETLEKKKTRLKADLKLTSKMLKEVAREKKSSLGELSILNKQLENRNKLIGTLQQEKGLLQEEIDDNHYELEVLGELLEETKQDYGKLVREAYKNKSQQSLLLFLFSSESFNDAYRRLKYVRYYNNYRSQQLDKIKDTQEEIATKNGALEIQKNKLEEVIQAEAQQNDKLLAEKKKKNTMVSSLKKKEKVLQKDVDKKKTAISSLDAEIRSIIQREIAASNAKANPGAPKNTTSTFAETPEAKALSSSFAKNKGKLPWPVKKGVITGKFGKNRHWEASNVEINNSGIDISAPQGSEVRAVFDGTVSQIIFSASFQSAVIIKHGSYFTVYSNLASVSVSKGEKVSTNQSIGIVSTDGATGRSEVHFEIWKATSKQNPQSWIKR